MKSKKRKAPPAPPHLEFEVVEITDPAEIAALEERCREAEAAFAAAGANSGKAKSVKKRVSSARRVKKNKRWSQIATTSPA